MLLVGPSFFMLGLTMASAIGNETTTDRGLFTVPQGLNNPLTDSNKYNLSTEMPSNVTTMNITSNSNITSDMNITNPNSTITPSTTKQRGMTTKGGIPKPTGASKTTTAKGKKHTSTSKTAEDIIGIVIIVMIIIVAFGCGIACYFFRNRQRRYSVDFMSRQDDANIPLSIVDPELPADTASQNGLKTFETTEIMTKESQDPETSPEGQEEPRRASKPVAAEADNSAVDPSAEPAAAPPTPHDSEDKPKEDAAEPGPPAPAQPSAEEKTDDEGGVSNKTSMESLKETNENNSNNADFTTADPESSNIFWAVPLDFPL